MRQFVVVVALLALGCAAICNAQVGEDGHEAGIYLITDFEGRHCRRESHEIVAPPLYGYEAFYGGTGNRSTAEVDCVRDAVEPEIHGEVARLEYNVVRKQTYAGLWLQWSVPGFDLAKWDALCFDIRGCDSSISGDCRSLPEAEAYFSSTIKVELKVNGWGWKTVYIDDITSDWMRVEIPIEWFEDTTWWYSAPRNEFVITLEEPIATADRGVFFIDNIRFERDPVPPPPMAFYSDLLDPTLGGLLALIDSASGLPYDVGTVSEAGIVVKESKTSPTNIGMLMSALVAGSDLELLPREQVEERILKIVSTLEGMEVWNGFFYNWYDLANLTAAGFPRVGAASIEEEDQRFVSSVDNANLTASMMVAAGAFPNTELASRLDGLIAEQNYSTFYRNTASVPDQVRPRISHGYNVAQDAYSTYGYGTFMTEARLLVFLALALEQVPVYPWMSSEPGTEGYMDAIAVDCNTGQEPVVAVGSWGGSLFEELFPDLFLDEKSYASNLAENHRRVVQVHIAHANPVTGLWGWSPSQSAACSYREAGVPCLGLGGGYPLGDVSAYSILLAARYAPAEAVAALSAMKTSIPESFDPRFGYCDSVSQDGTRYCADVLSLDKGMEFLGLVAVLQELGGKPSVSQHFWAFLDDHQAGEVGRRLMQEVGFEPYWENAV